MDILGYIASFIFVLALIGAGAWLLRKFVLDGNGSPITNFFATREKRLGVVETASIDARHRLILIRRDDVEHLIMTGGPVDMVIETGISPPETTSPSYSNRRNSLFEGAPEDQQNHMPDYDVEEEEEEQILTARGHDRASNSE